MNSKYLSIFIAASLLVFLGASSRSELNDTNFKEAKEIIIMRKIGHEVLLHSGDSTSRVLPIKQVAENEYQIQFASRFTFKPDSLVKIIQRTIHTNKLPTDYIVNVIDCATNEVIFGYAISEAEQTNIIPCIGRQQSKSCYYLNIAFQGAHLSNLASKYVTAGISLLALVLVFSGAKIYYKKKSIPGKDDKSFKDNFIPIGKYHFYNDKRCLINNNEQIELTHKETKLLHIFASTPNEVIDRNRLQKEIWEDEGIIVGRSLDVFISKLRKKLENDSTVKLVNIHGKGYKLDISS